VGIFFKKEGFLSEEEEMHVLIKNDSVMERAHESYKKFTSSDKMLEIYEAREKRIRDEASNIAYAREQGIEQGGLLDKQEVLIRLAEKKFGLSEEGRKLIKTVTDSQRLDDALDIILFAGNSEEVLNCLRS